MTRARSRSAACTRLCVREQPRYFWYLKSLYCSHAGISDSDVLRLRAGIYFWEDLPARAGILAAEESLRLQVLLLEMVGKGT